MRGYRRECGEHVQRTKILTDFSFSDPIAEGWDRDGKTEMKAFFL